jgi:hypothetical protein
LSTPFFFFRLGVEFFLSLLKDLTDIMGGGGRDVDIEEKVRDIV